ncbi:MAG: nitroreductase family protein [Acidobacteriota bacterium]|nr:nitroreductase family protein [Acidobacteriota bacterium]
MSTQADVLTDIPSEKLANTLPSVHEIFRARWSPRAFADRPVSSEDLKTILEAARWAASSYNEQPWRFIVAGKTDGAFYEKLLGLLDPFNQAWARSAPVLIITAAKRHFTHNGNDNFHALHDAGAALAHFALQATALGLHAHGMAGFDHEKARQELGIPDEYELGAAMALGYLGSPDTLSDSYREREHAPRARKPLSELVFGGHWDRPLDL